MTTWFYSSWPGNPNAVEIAAIKLSRAAASFVSNRFFATHDGVSLAVCLSMASSTASSSVLSSSTPVFDPFVYTNYVNVHLSIDKLDGTYYVTWVSDIKLWL